MPLPLVLAAPTVVNGVTLLVGGVAVADSINQSLRNNVNKGYSDNYDQQPLGGFETVPILGTNSPSSPPENPVWDGKSTGTGALANQQADSRRTSLRDSYMPLVGVPPSQPQSPTQAQGRSSSVPTPRSGEILQRKLSTQLGSSADLLRNTGNAISESAAAIGRLRPNLPTPFSFGFPISFGDSDDRKVIDDILKQREAIAIDNARINNTPIPNAPPFKGGQVLGANYNVNINFKLRHGNNPNLLSYDVGFSGIGKISSIEEIYGATHTSKRFRVVFADGTDESNTFNFVAPVRDFSFEATVVRIGGVDNGGDPAPLVPNQSAVAPPPYPDLSNWEYGEIPVTVGGSNPIVQPSVKPFAQSDTVKPFKEPDKQIDVEQPDISKNPDIPKTPSGFNFVPPNQTVNNNIVIASNTQSASQDTPSISTTPDVFDQAKADFDKYYSVGYGLFNTSGTNGIVAGVNSSYGAKPSTENKAKTFVAVKQQESQPYDKGSQVTPNKPAPQPDNRPPNTTPTTPTTSNQNDSNFGQTIASVLGLTALVTALKVGSDAFVNASLPKIDNINNNTSPQAQQTNAKQGICDAMQPTQCGYEGVKQATTEATQPIKDVAIANNGMLANILSALANLGSTIANLFGNVVGKLDGIREFLERVWANEAINKAMQYVTMITVIHNAAMLSRSLVETLGSALDSGLQVFGLQIKDKEGNQLGITTALGKTFENLIKGIIGADNYTALTDTWIQANRIYQTGINLLSNVQSILDSTTAVAELTSNRLGTWMNAARSAGLVRENAYGAQSENVTKFNAFTNKLENLEQGASNLASITGNVLSVQQTVTEIQTNRQEFDNALKNKPQGTGLPENDPAKLATATKKEQSLWTIADFSIVKPPETP